MANYKYEVGSVVWTNIVNKEKTRYIGPAKIVKCGGFLKEYKDNCYLCNFPFKFLVGGDTYAHYMFRTFEDEIKFLIAKGENNEQ